MSIYLDLDDRRYRLRKGAVDPMLDQLRCADAAGGILVPSSVAHVDGDLANVDDLFGAENSLVFESDKKGAKQ